MHGAGEPKGRLVGQKEPNTANDHQRQRLAIVSVAQESGLVYPNEETLFSQGLSLSIKAEISSRLNRKELASCIVWLERTEACGFPAG